MADSSTEKFRRADAVFDAALDVEPAKRAAFVESACGADTVLRADVDRLLRAHDRIDDFLITPLVSVSSAESGDNPIVPIPPRIGVYRIERELGRGGMGVVYLAERDDREGDSSSRSVVALKAVRTGPLGAGSIVRRFLAERQILASLDHPNVARLLDAGVTADGMPYFAMEYCAGGSLADRVAARGNLSLDEALAVARQLASALGAAHARGVVHRDVKPGNVLFDAEDRVRLSDFGIAKILGEDSTRSGAVLGTVSYLAPEQIQGRSVDHRADLWALGVTLYEMLSGRRPFTGDSYAAVLHAVLTAEPAPLDTVPGSLRELVTRLLAKDPEARPQSAREVEAILDAVARGEASPSARRSKASRRLRWSRRWQLVAGATLGVAIAAYGVLALRGRPSGRPVTNAQAYDLYVRGLSLWSTRTRDGIEGAIAYYRRALAEDPKFALAYSGMADAYVNLSNFDYDGASDALPRALAAAKQAVALDPSRAEGYASLGFVLESQLALAPAESAFQRAIALNPRYLWAHHYYSLLLAMMNRPTEARTEAQLVLDLDPLATQAQAHLGVVWCLEGRLDEAAQQLRKATAITPSFSLALYYSGAVAAAQGRFTDATSALEGARHFSAGFPGVLAALAYSYRKTGRRAAADSIQRELRAQTTSLRGRTNIALADAALGNIDAAFRELSRVQLDMPTVIELRADPLLARLRADPRYPALLRSLGLPQ